MNDEKKPEAGIELDALEVDIATPAPTPPPSPSPPPEAPREASTETEPQPAPETGPEKKSKKSHKLGIIMAGSVIALAAVVLFLWSQKDPGAPSKKDQTAAGHSDLKASIGPIITNAGETGNIIRMTIEINCENSESKAKISDMTSLIKSRMILSMSSQSAVKMAELKDFRSLEFYLVDELKDILKGTAIRGIRLYFSDFLTQ
jgi:flagellar basal body-associated protein FliL